MASPSTSNPQTTVDRSRTVLKPDEIRRECRQFRILVIGKANAGKTTILRKVCNASPDVKPIVYDADGNLIVVCFMPFGGCTVWPKKHCQEKEKKKTIGTKIAKGFQHILKASEPKKVIIRLSC